MMKWTLLISMILFVVITEHLVKSQELLFKNFARSNRASRGPDEFEKFFLKASKSVPRIGRRDFETESSNENRQLYQSTMNDGQEIQHPKFKPFGKKFDPALKELSWYDLADKVEYYPEILISPGFLASAGFKDSDFPIENKRMNVQGTEKNKEITEYRLQPES